MFCPTRKLAKILLVVAVASIVWSLSYLFISKDSVVPCVGGHCEVIRTNIAETSDLNEGLGNVISVVSNEAAGKGPNKNETSPDTKQVSEENWTKEASDATMFQAQRYEQLRKFCGPNKASYSFSKFHYLIYNDKRKVIYCYVPKVACTQWKRIFMLFDGYKTDNQESIPMSKVHEGYTYKRLSSLSHPEALKRLNDYTKIMFVREPFERLVSAYRDKFMKENEWFANAYGKEIVRKYRKNATAESLRKGNDVKFHEFVKFIVDGGDDEHWMPQPELCQPCAIDYDVLGHYETLEIDANLALRIAGVTDIKFPKVRYSDTTKYLKEYFSKIPKGHIAKLIQKYRRDYNAFQLEVPEVMKHFLN